MAKKVAKSQGHIPHLRKLYEAALLHVKYTGIAMHTLKKLAEPNPEAILLCLRAVDFTFVNLVNEYNRLNDSQRMLLGEANEHKPIYYRGSSAPSWLEYVIEVGGTWRIAIRCKLGLYDDEEHPLQPLEFPDSAICESFRWIAKRVEWDYTVKISDLQVELLTESRRVWIKGGKKGAAPGKPGPKPLTNRDKEFAARYDKGEWETQEQLRQFLGFEHVSTVSKMLRKGGSQRVKSSPRSE